MGRRGFYRRSGIGLRNQFCGIADALFTEDGFACHARDALERMVNPYLRDPIDRVTRDPSASLDGMIV